MTSMFQGHLRFSGFFYPEVMLDKTFQFIHIEESLISAMDHCFKLANQVLERGLISVCLSFSIHKSKLSRRVESVVISHSPFFTSCKD